MNTWASSRKGFTVVEMIIAIVVIAILATIVITSYNVVLQRSRDSERKSDVTKIRIALDKYYAANGQYPNACGTDNTACTVPSLNTPLEPYLPIIPLDPIGPVNEYQYIRGGTSGNAYGLRVNYEATADCMVGVRLTTTWWSSLPVCD